MGMKMFLDRKFRLARRWSNRELRKIGPLMTGDVINVSGWRDEDKEGGRYRDYFPHAMRYRLSNYTDTRGRQGGSDEISLDLTAPCPPALERQFDTVFNHTTLEHIFDVMTAFRTLCLLSRDIVIVVVPFAQEQHERNDTDDFWRFSPTCLRRLFSANGFSTVYESANDEKNSSVYIFMVAARDPGKWRNLMPVYSPVRQAAWRLGRTWRSDRPWIEAIERRLMGRA